MQPKTSQGLVLAGVLALGFAAVPGSSAAGNGACERVLGEWHWFDNGTVTFTSDRKAVWRSPLIGEIGHTANWQCETRTGAVTLPWTNGFTDVMTLSLDGRSLQGRKLLGITVDDVRETAPLTALIPLREVALVQHTLSEPGTILTASPGRWNTSPPGGGRGTTPPCSQRLQHSVRR